MNKLSEEEIINTLENYDNEDNLSKIHKAIQRIIRPIPKGKRKE